MLLTLALAVSFFGCDAIRDGFTPTGTPSSGSSGDNSSGHSSQEEESEENEEPNEGEKPSGNNPNEDEEPNESEDPSESETPEDPPAWASDFDLPNADDALQKLTEIYGGADKVFLLRDGKIARMPCPQNEVITVNVALEPGEYTKLILEDSIAEFNEVFAVINPNYKFKINYSPTEDDFAQKYSIKLVASNNLSVTETSQVFGVAHMGYYNNYTELGDFGITIKTEVFNNGSYLMTTFKHELMHLLGAGDAYKNSNATSATVMQSYTVGGYHHLSATDVAFLDTLYRNPEFSGDEKIDEFIDTYEQNTLHTRAILTAAVYNKLVSELDPEAIMTQATELGYADLTDFFATISDGITRDATFGSKNISFRELEYVEAPSKMYFGSIEPQNNRYWHGEGIGSMGITYTDYGNGVLYAAPNGNKYTILIKTGEYVLALRLSGSFTDFDALSLALWHVSK